MEQDLTALAQRLQSYLDKRYVDAKVFNFSYITSGWECDIYAFTLATADEHRRDYIVRAFNGDDGATKSSHETKGMRQLYQAGYPVPEILLHEADSSVLGKPFIIMEKLDGQALWGVLASVEPVRESQLLEQFGQVIARLHQLDWQPFTEHAARYTANPTAILDDSIAKSRQQYIEFNVESLLAITNWLETHKTRITVKPAVVHLDFHANNVFLREDNRLAVIDWSQIAVSDYRMDLSWTTMLMSDYGKPQWRTQILDAYAQAIGYPVIDLDYFDVFSYSKQLASTLISLKVGAEKLGLRAESMKCNERGEPNVAACLSAFASYYKSQYPRSSKYAGRHQLINLAKSVLQTCKYSSTKVAICIKLAYCEGKSRDAIRGCDVAGFKWS